MNRPKTSKQVAGSSSPASLKTPAKRLPSRPRKQRGTQGQEIEPEFDQDQSPPTVWSPTQWRQEMLVGKALAALLLAALLGWALLGAPGATGWRHDLGLVSRMCADNALTFVVFNLLGLLPATLVPLMVPAHLSDNQVPLAPFLGASFAVGAFSLLLYLVGWRVPYHDPHLPPSSNTFQGKPIPRVVLRACESRWLPATLLVSTTALLSLVAVANPATWADFWRLFHSSRLVHVMTLDLLLQHVLAVVFVARDSRLRGFHHRAVVQRLEASMGQQRQGRVSRPSRRGQLVFWGMAALELLVVLVPVVGTQLYLLVRPISSNFGRKRHPAAAPAGEEGAADNPLHALQDRAQGLLHTTSGGLRRLWGHAVHAAHAVFPEGTVVRRHAQGAKRQLRRVLSWVFQGGHIAYARQPIRQYSVSKEFQTRPERQLWEQQRRMDAAAAAAQEEEEEDDPAEADGPLEQEEEEEDTDVGEQEQEVSEEEDAVELEGINVRTRAGGAGPRHSSLQHSLSDAARALAAATGLHVSTSPTTSSISRSTRAAKEAALRSLAAMAPGARHAHEPEQEVGSMHA